MLEQTNTSLLGHSGKQLRPQLALLVARAAGGAANGDSVKYAVASELLHNATLLHDDVADQSDTRRGMPTLRSIMGPSVSVLVGDFWLVRAVRAILDADKGREKAVSLFARTLADLAEGEMLQLQKASTCDTSFDDYLAIIYRKTASLFVATTLSAALSVGASAEAETAAEEFGRCLGYAFQMRDDIFDYMPSADVGKPVGVDLMEQKITLPLLCALEGVPVEEQRRIRAMVKDITEEKRRHIVDFVHRMDGLEKAQAVLEDYVAKAVEALGRFPSSRDTVLLEELAGYIATRQS